MEGTDSSMGQSFMAFLQKSSLLLASGAVCGTKLDKLGHHNQVAKKKN